MKKHLLTMSLAVVVLSLQAQDYQLRVLTFEDADFHGVASQQCTKAADWSSLVDNPQYGGKLLYGEDGMGSSTDDYYFWSDNGNTGLAHELPYNWGSYCYWGGGHAISNYGSGEQAAYGDYSQQLTVFHNGVTGLTQKGNGHNGSDNFVVHYGYHDESGWSSDNTPYIYFSDGIARVIDHMYVTNTCYAINCYADGNGLTPKIGDTDWVKIVATGDNGNTAEFYLCNGPENIVSDWTKFDLSSLGEVTMVNFNITGSSDNGYGFSQPAYFAYDDVAVRYPVQSTLTDDQPYVAASEATASETSYTRADVQSRWGTVCLPFDVESNTDVQYYRLSEASTDVLTFEPVNEVKAGIPAVFKKLTSATELTLSAQNVTLKAVSDYNTEDTPVSGWTMKGTLTGATIQGTDKYYISQDKFWYAEDQVTVKPFRAWFETTDAQTARSLTISVIDNGTTSILTVGADGELQEQKAYDLSGRRINTNANGIMIINGKKVIK